MTITALGLKVAVRVRDLVHSVVGGTSIVDQEQFSSYLAGGRAIYFSIIFFYLYFYTG